MLSLTTMVMMAVADILLALLAVFVPLSFRRRRLRRHFRHLTMAQSSSGRLVHVVRLGTAAAPLDQYLRGHDDAVSWAPDVASAIAFLTADAARRFAARRLGGVWHVTEVDHSAFRRVVIDEEMDELPDRDAGVVLIKEERDWSVAARRRATRVHGSSPWAA